MLAAGLSSWKTIAEQLTLAYMLQKEGKKAAYAQMHMPIHKHMGVPALA